LKGDFALSRLFIESAQGNAAYEKNILPDIELVRQPD
jgi:hypothetical protein